jgi:hypothetical protein
LEVEVSEEEFRIAAQRVVGRELVKKMRTEEEIKNLKLSAVLKMVKCSFD